MEENRITLRGFYGEVASIRPDLERLPFLQKLFGYTREDLQVIMAPMASTGQEPVGSMGADTPLAVFSEKNQLLFGYFKQLFAQVTNPPIDPVREELVMSLMTFIGNPGNILMESPRSSRLIKLLHPFLTNEDLTRLRELEVAGFRAQTISMGFPVKGAGVMLETALDRLGHGDEVAGADFDDAHWVGCRLAQLLPLKLEQKQGLLEMDDALERLAGIGGALEKLA